MKPNTYISFITFIGVYKIYLIVFKWGFRYNFTKPYQNILSVMNKDNYIINDIMVGLYLYKMYIHINNGYIWDNIFT